MRVLKCYLANDREGHFVTAGEVMNAPGQVWSCASCGCRLVLHAGTFSDPAWFEHDTQTVARDVLMNCAHLDPEVKAEARHRKLRNMPNGLDATVMMLSWYCVWCSDHYQGVKHCYRCQTGIYSIEEVNWQKNYCCSTGE
ncbi:putative zinc ribbon protein [Citrobacter farmeri]|uniref:putative zinc ribbon protein n=1 Tax=Citrobacter farmeri TaxID=67824 RepID=UPI002A807ACF|nr:putative zinc ribbon protein [Citrobacter farmeri]